MAYTQIQEVKELKEFLLILMYFFIIAWCSFMELYKSHKNN